MPPHCRDRPVDPWREDAVEARAVDHVGSEQAAEEQDLRAEEHPHAERGGIPLLVDNPKEVGADRIVNCLAAFQKYGTAAIVIDFGSSICVDVVSTKGEFLGGAIAPGVQVSSDAAAARSAALRRVELTRPRSVVGKNTVECMQAGAVFGFAGLVDGLVSRIREDVDGFAGAHVAVVATGHTAPLVLPDLHTVEHYDQHLTLDGLRLVFERNRDSSRGRLKQAR